MPLPRPAPGTGTWWAVGAIGVLLGVALATWWGVAATAGHVTWTDTGYEVVDDRTVVVDFEVHRPDGQAVTCVVRALDQGFAPVGAIEVEIPASEQKMVTRRVTVRTTTRAVTGVVQRCTDG